MQRYNIPKPQCPAMSDNVLICPDKGKIGVLISPYAISHSTTFPSFSRSPERLCIKHGNICKYLSSVRQLGSLAVILISPPSVRVTSSPSRRMPGNWTSRCSAPMNMESGKHKIQHISLQYGERYLNRYKISLRLKNTK